MCKLDEQNPEKDLTMTEAFRSWPQLISLFLNYKLDCVGCYMANHCTFKNVLQAYDIDQTRFLQEVSQITGIDVSIDKP